MAYKIPAIIHYTFKNNNLPKEIINVIEQNKRMCPGCEFRFYDDVACEAFIKDNFPDEVFAAFKKLNPIYGAMKADFFRYCVLYKLGGIYIDIKTKIKVPIFSLIRPDDICILDIPKRLETFRKCTKPTFEQWLLMFAPEHPYLRCMISLMVHYTQIRYEPRQICSIVLNTKQKILNVTGPDAFTKAIYRSNSKHKQILHRHINYTNYFVRAGTSNYKNMYAMNGEKHYSEYREPLYV